jgi:hypothetical protein
MLTLAEAKLALDAGGVAIKLFDKLYPRIVRVLSGNEPDKESSVRIEKRGDDLIASRHGKPGARVTYQDLMERLSPDDVGHIRMFERSMALYEAQIEKAYPQLAVLPTIERAQTEVRLKQMIGDMQKDLLGILNFILASSQIHARAHGFEPLSLHGKFC